MYFVSLTTGVYSQRLDRTTHKTLKTIIEKGNAEYMKKLGVQGDQLVVSPRVTNYTGKQEGFLTGQAIPVKRLPHPRKGELCKSP